MASSTVLVVDDDPDIRETVGLVLQRHGYTVTTAADGAEALERLRGSAPRPCLILLDLMMPRMNGFDFWDAIGESDLKSIPVVVLTGAGPMAAARAQQMHLEVLRKPFGLTELLRTVGRLCH
jgi:two-component system chemotaxis response regulator CheY